MATQVEASERRRAKAEGEAVASALRDAARPGFDLTFRASAESGASAKRLTAASTSFEFAPRGRVPALRVRASKLLLSPAAVVQLVGTGGQNNMPLEYATH